MGLLEGGVLAARCVECLRQQACTQQSKYPQRCSPDEREPAKSNPAY